MRLSHLFTLCVHAHRGSWEMCEKLLEVPSNSLHVSKPLIWEAVWRFILIVGATFEGRISIFKAVQRFVFALQLLLMLKMSCASLTGAALWLPVSLRQEVVDAEAEQLGRRRHWEEGRIEYLGRDAFENIQRMLDGFLKWSARHENPFFFQCLFCFVFCKAKFNVSPTVNGKSGEMLLVFVPVLCTLIA